MGDTIFLVLMVIFDIIFIVGFALLFADITEDL